MDTRAKYESLVKIFAEAYPSLKKSDQQKKAQIRWNEVKAAEEKYNAEVLRLKSIAAEIKSQHIKCFFNKAKKREVPSPQPAPPELVETISVEDEPISEPACL